MIAPHTFQGDHRVLGAGVIGSIRGRTSVDIGKLLMEAGRRGHPASRTPYLSSNFLDARNQLVSRFLHWHFFADDTVHRFRPYVLVIEDSEFVVFGEFERRRPGG